MGKIMFFSLLILINVFVLSAQASQSEIIKMETELKSFNMDLIKAENNRDKMELQQESMLDILQMQYKNILSILNLAKEGDKDITDQSMRSMRLILQQSHNLLKQLFGEYLKD